MEDQLGALGLVVNVMMLWTTLYMDRALDQLRGLGATVNDEDVARLSPLGTNHINVLGRYHFSLPDAIARGEFRPLRDPSDFDDDVSGGKTPREPRSAMLRACSNSSSCSLQEQHGKLRHGYDNAAADARRVPSTPSRPP